MTFQVVCYDWVSFNFCKEGQENWDRNLWERTTATQNGETLLLQAIQQRFSTKRSPCNEEQDLRESQHYLQGLN